MEITVQVLLSTYNGERYLREQLDSILNQQGVRCSLLIRDDGSTDRTCGILKEYQEKQDNVTVLYEKNVGVIQSFFELIDNAGEECNYFSFADQDDVWLPDKLYRAVSMLQNEEKTGRKPLAYCSSTQLVDEMLQPLSSAIRYKKVRPEFGNALVENMCTGCTCVINRELLVLLQKKRPEFTVMHDFWIYLVGTCFGKVLYDTESRILYRQHGGNELGAASSLVENYRRRFKNRKKHRGQLSRQATALIKCYGSGIPQEKRELAELVVKAKNNIRIRKKLLQEHRVFRQRKSDNFIFIVLMAVGRI